MSSVEGRSGERIENTETPAKHVLSLVEGTPRRQVRKSISFLCALCVLCARYSEFRLRLCRFYWYIFSKLKYEGLLIGILQFCSPVCSCLTKANKRCEL